MAPSGCILSTLTPEEITARVRWFRENGDGEEGKCLFCNEGQMEGGEEGYFCMQCGNITNICEFCDGNTPMQLLNYYYGDEYNDSGEQAQLSRSELSATFPPANAGKPFRGILSSSDDGSFYYIDDQTVFWWKCLDCGKEYSSCCD
jgi:hypothetical protein